MARARLLSCIFALTLPACSGGSGSGEGEGDGSVETADARLEAPDAATELDDEIEPNNGSSATDVHALDLPVGVRGAIGEADDVDVFAVELAAGELLEWRLVPDSAAFAPHLALVDAASEVPVSVAFAEAGEARSLHHLALQGGTYYVIVRDARNVPASSSEGIGGGDVAYTLHSGAPTLAAIPVTPSERVSATLAHPFELADFRFTLTEEASLAIEVFAQRASPASDTDSRLSLYDQSRDTWLITNDDPSLDQKDSLVTGTLPAGEYQVVVDNLNPEAAMLSFEVDFLLEP